MADIKASARKARRGETLTDEEQARLCAGCLGTGDAVWVGGAAICQRRRCKYRSSQKSRYFKERRR